MIRLLACFHCLVELVVCIVYNRLVRHEITAYMISLVQRTGMPIPLAFASHTGGNSHSAHTVHGSERCEMRRAVRQNAFVPPRFIRRGRSRPRRARRYALRVDESQDESSRRTATGAQTAAIMADKPLVYDGMPGHAAFVPRFVSFLTRFC